MDYSKLSDFEVNLKLAHILLGKDNYDWNSDKKEVYLAGIDGGEFLSNGYFDPCNNPTDAWPIILSKLISVEPDYEFIDPSEEQVFASGAWIAEHFDGKGEHLQYVDINPLRAAMIVFLMTQDSANVPANSTGSDIR